MQSIVYPQVRTSADVLKSTIRLETLIPFLQQQKAEACAIVHSKLYGLLPFWQQMKQADIHPVIGLEVSVQFNESLSLPVVLYAKNNEGYKHLLKISSAVSIRKEENLPFRWLHAYRAGCVVVVPLQQLECKWLSHIEQVQQLKECFQIDVYIGLARQYGKEQEQQCITFANDCSLPIIALHKSTFLHKEDHFAYEVARAIDQATNLNDVLAETNKQSFYMPSNEEMFSLFAGQEQWLENTRRLLLSCKVELSFGSPQMPKYPLPERLLAKDALRQKAFAGLAERIGFISKQYEERLAYELSVIEEMDYADYFLIVADFMQFAREQQILTGPGRGSSASSLVAYALYITHVDPIQYDLLFERFLNPERVSLPDIDIDFVDTRRQEVIHYVAQKYGKQHVAQIITFGTLSAKAVARDVARMFQFDADTLSTISKMIPNRLGVTLRQAYEESEQLRTWVAQEPQRKRWLQTAFALEGLPRNSSTHAAGVVLSEKALVETVPIEGGHDDIYLTQWPMQEVEQAGLLKMDFLGLRNLTILEQICRSVAQTNGVQIDLQKLPFDDEKTFQLLQRGDTTGVFQLESEGMRGALREIQPTQFLDIVAVNALYRPGPMDFIPVYARRKRGLEQVELFHPVLEPILRETYGVIVYQEQIMKIANVFAGFTIGQADLLRRAVSKKKREVLEQQREAFVNGALQQGHSAQIANDIYELIVRFADYGFPKSHAVAYSVISYQLAYLKANYPVNFYAALLTNATGNAEKLAQLIQEAKQKGIELLPPSISKSMRHFKVENKKIRFSLSAIKGVTQPFLQKVLEVRQERQQGFADLFDLAMSTNSHFSKKVVEPLVKAGALDEFGRERAVLLATIEAAQKHADFANSLGEKDSFFAFGKPKHIQVEPLSSKEKLQFEREVLGFYLSEHPIESLRKTIETTATVQSLQQMKEGSYVTLLGTIVHIRQLRTKKGELMAFVQLEDEYGTVSLTLFPREFAQIGNALQEEVYAFVEGQLEFRQAKPQIKVKRMYVKQI